MAVIATLSGTGLTPGVSKNSRYYSPDLIAGAVERAQARIADPDARPITMRVAHPRPDDQPYVPVTEIVGRVTGMTQAGDGSMRFTADLYDSTAGRDVLALADNRDQTPALKNVSIRGRWLGDIRTEVVDGTSCETADAIDLDGLDFTHLPGVDGAQVDTVAAPGTPLEAATHNLIYESCEETHVTETTTETAPAVVVPHADLGYLADGKHRWPLTTLSEARTAWAALHESDTADKYTAKQLKRVRERAAKALRGHGVEVRRDLAEGAGPVLVQRGQVVEGVGYDGNYIRPGEFFVRLDNGAVCITVSSCSIDPHDLGRIGTAAMGGAVQALLAMDPDDDGDIDVPGAPYQDVDDDMGESTTPTEAENAEVLAEASITETPASTEDAETTTTESEASDMSDATLAPTEVAPITPAETPAAPAMVSLTQEALAGIVGAAVEAVAAKFAAAAPVVEAAPAVEAKTVEVAETEDQRVTRLVSEALAARDAQDKANTTRMLQTEVFAGRITPARKGLVGHVGESGSMDLVGEGADDGINAHGLPTKWAGNKAPHELVGAQRAGMSGLLFEHVIGSRS